MIGFDAVPPEVDALRAGTIRALIAQDPEKAGHELVASLADYLTAHPSTGPVTPIDSKFVDNAVLTKDTVNDPANAGFIYQAACS